MNRFVFITRAIDLSTGSGPDFQTMTVVVRLPMGWYVSKYLVYLSRSSIDMMLIPDDQHILSPEDFRGPFEVLTKDA
jgi:hypothetical protein